MLEALEGPKNRGQQVQVRHIPLPVNGWSTRDKYTASFTREALRYCALIDNWMVIEGRLEVRPGFSTYATGMTDPVYSMMEYAGPDGTRKIFAATYATSSACKIWDVTSSGAASSVHTGLSGAEWQHVMFATTSGSYLMMANGADAVKAFDGTSWTTPTLTGVTSANIIGITSHKGRLWLTEKSTLNAWYLPAFAITGTVSKFNLATFCKRGGYLMGIASWSLDSGTGPDDYIVFVTSEGEVVVYSGLDPNSVDEWSLVGVYKIDRPISRRCFTKFGADLAIFTESGIVRLSQILGGARPRDAISDPIREAFVAAVGGARSTFGWEVFEYSTRGWLMANVPLSVSNKYEQYIFNPLMGAWFRFTGLNGRAWVQSGNYLYFGGTGETYIWDNGQADDDGSAVTADIGFAWWNYGAATVKRFSLMRPHFFTDGEVTPIAEMKCEFDESDPVSEGAGAEAVTGTEWDAGDWDTFDWASGLVAIREWLTAEGEGTVAAPRIKVSTLSARIALTAVDVAYMDGGIL